MRGVRADGRPHDYPQIWFHCMACGHYVRRRVTAKTCSDRCDRRMRNRRYTARHRARVRFNAQESKRRRRELAAMDFSVLSRELVAAGLAVEGARS